MESRNWRRNLYVMFVAEFIVIMGLSFVIPLMPLFVQELGDFDSAEISRWSGIAVGISGISLFLSGPVWGIISDRWGRKPMVLRAMFGSAVVLVLSGLSPDVYILIILRFIHGLFSGTVPAASALVASSAPRDKTAYVMGLLMVAVFIGNTIGPTFGGIIAEYLGIRISFFVSGALLFSGGVMVSVLVRENFERPAQIASLGSVWRLVASRQFLPLLTTIGIIGMAGMVAQPMVLLFMQELNPGGAVAAQTGLAFTLMGIIAALSSVFTGKLGEKFSLKNIMICSCIGAALTHLIPFGARTAVQFIIMVGIMGLFQGGLMTITTSLVGLSLPVSQQGVAYGMMQSAVSLGRGLGPIIGGYLAPLTGLRYVFGVPAGLFLVSGVMASKFIGRNPQRGRDYNATSPEA